MVNWQDRTRAAALHLGGGLLVALVAGVLVLGVWYPYPYREISGGRELFILLMAVDVVLGPLTTFAVFDLRKGWPVLRRDLSVIVVLQLTALGYGLWTSAEARPVHLVFEKDRFRVVHALEVPAELIPKAPAGIDALPWTGPSLISVRTDFTPAESLEVTIGESQGVALASRPDYWQSYDDARFQLLTAAQPLRILQNRFPASSMRISEEAAKQGRTVDELLFLPLFSRRAVWSALVDSRTAEVVGYVPLDPYESPRPEPVTAP